MVPKTLALQRAEQTSLWITRPVLWVKAALYPLVTVCFSVMTRTNDCRIHLSGMAGRYVCLPDSRARQANAVGCNQLERLIRDLPRETLRESAGFGSWTPMAMLWPPAAAHGSTASPAATSSEACAMCIGSASTLNTFPLERSEAATALDDRLPLLDTTSGSWLHYGAVSLGYRW
jgi:hypothetical protein